MESAAILEFQDSVDIAVRQVFLVTAAVLDSAVIVAASVLADIAVRQVFLVTAVL
jgi:hypothetical protein